MVAYEVRVDVCTVRAEYLRGVPSELAPVKAFIRVDAYLLWILLRLVSIRHMRRTTVAQRRGCVRRLFPQGLGHRRVHRPTQN